MIWTRCHRFPWYERTVEQREEFVLLRVARFEPRPDPAALATEGVREVRWWTLEELESASATFAPRDLAAHLRELVEHGPPAVPIDVDV